MDVSSLGILVYVEDSNRTTYLQPRNMGFSPGAAVSDSFFSDMMWAMAETVAATYHGRPSREVRAMQTPTTSMSKW